MTGITGKLAKLRNAARVSISAKGIAKAAKKRRFLRFADEIISVPKLDTGHALGMFGGSNYEMIDWNPTSRQEFASALPP
ncbi:hypothetical protein OLZ29_26700 [Rhizobium sp. 1AS13]|nr:hypothetical protein [Rhizobium acaciae]